MAVARMHKVTVIGHSSIRDEVLDRLQESGVLDIVVSDLDLPSFTVTPDDPRVIETSEELSEMQFVQEFFKSYHQNPTKMAMFVSEKFHLSEEEYQELQYTQAHRDLFEEVRDLNAKLDYYEAHQAEVKDKIARLKPWEGNLSPISSWHSTALTKALYGLIPSDHYSIFKTEIREVSPYVDITTAPSSTGVQGVILRVHRHDYPKLRDFLSQYEAFTPAENLRKSLKLELTPAEEIKNLNTELEEMQGEHEARNLRAAELSDKYFSEVAVLIQKLKSAKERLVVNNDVNYTDSTFVIRGYVPVKQEAELKAGLEDYCDALDLSFEEPDNPDEVPIVLDNPKWAQPFEVITDLYGRPKYGEIDPTIPQAPFFALFFAICIGDVGYGLMLAVAMWVIMTTLDVAPAVKRFCKLMIYGGLTAVPVGILTGSYLALPYETLPSFLQNLKVIDPLEEIVAFLGVMLVLGLIQVVVGILIAAYDAARKRDYATAIGSNISTLFFLVAIAVYAATRAQHTWILSAALIVTMMLQGKAITKAFKAESGTLDKAFAFFWMASAVLFGVSTLIPMPANLALYIWLGASVVGLAFSKATRKVIGATLLGAYEVYGMTGIVNDALSYTRLAALSLSGALVGMVFNLLAEMVWTPALAQINQGGFNLVLGVFIALISALIFVVGHSFNVTINLLGAFVHPLRLQFVEFFGKFYSAGGRNYEPFAFKKKNIVLSGMGAEKIGKKGGTSR